VISWSAADRRAPTALREAETTAPLEQPAELRAYYRDDGVVRSYLRRRTAQPLNGYLHAQQVCFLNQVLRQREPRRVLELAPGPARLTAEMEFRGCGVAIDASPEMLSVARQRLREAGRNWSVMCGDGFSLPLAPGSVDMVVAVRFLRRFRPLDRARLYDQVRRVLDPNGVLVLDAQNRAVCLPHRQSVGLQRYPVFDQLYDQADLVGELEESGFVVRRIEGMVRHFNMQRRVNRLRRFGMAPLARRLIGWAEALPGGVPSTWMVLCEVRK
jgi:SAM-dependent methyltransferase